MADNILKLRVESSEYDQKLKKAAEGIRHLAEVAHRGGGELTGLEKAELDYVKSLGTMETKSRTAAGSVRELESTFKELTVVYNHLNDVEKQDEGGKALRASLDQIKQRALEARTELEAASKSLQGTESMKGGGGLFSGIGSKMEGALAVFGGNLMTKASEAVVRLGSEMYGMVQQGIELARQGEGIRIAFERLGRGDILDGLRQATHGTVTDLELMKAAVKFNDFKLPLDQLGTMLAFAQQKAKDTGQSIDYMTESLVTGLGRKSLMILDNLGLSANEIKEKMKQTGDMTKAVGAIIREQMAKSGDYVETAADRAAQANVSLQNKMEELGRKFAPIEEASNQLWTSMKIGILDIIGGPLARMLNELTEAGRQINALRDINGDSSNGAETRSGKALRILREYSGGGRGIEGKRELYDRQVASFQNQEEKEWRKANRLRDELAGLRKQQRENGAAGNLSPLIQETSRQLEEAVNRAKAFRIVRNEYEKGAQDIIKPVNANVNTKQAEQNVASLRRQLKELEEQRKNAVKSGDQEQVENLTKQISQVKTNIGYLDPRANKTGSSSKTAQTELQGNQAKINTLTQEYVKLGDESTEAARERQAEIQKEIELLQQRNGLLGLRAEQAQGRLLSDEDMKRKAEIDIQVNTKQIEDLRKQLTEIEGVTIDPKSVTITATDEALPKLREIEDITIDDKTMTVTAETADALRALQGIEGVTIDPKSVTITATDEALPKLREIEGITINDKTMTVTVETSDALRALQGIEGVTVDPKTIEVNANTSEAQQKIDDLKAKIAELEGKNINIQAFIENIEKPLGEGLNKTPGTLLKAPTTAVYENGVKTEKAVPRGGLQLSDKQMKAVNKNTQKEEKTTANITKEVGNIAGGIGSVVGGLEQLGLDIPEGIKGAVGVLQTIVTIVSGIATTVIAIQALTAADSFLPFARGGIVPHAAGGYFVGGSHYSGDVTPIMANAGELVLNRAQQFNLASQLQGGGMQGLNLTATIRGEQIRLALNNNGRRTGRGEYVQSRNVR